MDADIKGVLYASRYNGEDVVVAFGHVGGELEVAETGMLMDDPDLPDVLEQHGIELVVWKFQGLVGDCIPSACPCCTGTASSGRG